RAGVSRRVPGVAVDLQVILEVEHVERAHADEDADAQLAGYDERLGRVDRQADGRVRPLQRRRRDRTGLEAEALALVAEGLALPRLPDHVHGLREARLALAVGHAEDVVGPRRAAAAHAEVEAPAAD